jgi:hypothetical protein
MSLPAERQLGGDGEGMCRTFKSELMGASCTP